MGQQIIRQPDGRFAVGESTAATLIVVDVTGDELIEWRAQQAAERARADTRAMLDRILSGRPRPYAQFTLSWEEAARRDREHGGTLLTESTEKEV